MRLSHAVVSLKYLYEFHFMRELSNLLLTWNVYSDNIDTKVMSVITITAYIKTARHFNTT